jgi:hypothetical protein
VNALCIKTRVNALCIKTRVNALVHQDARERAGALGKLI